MGVVVQLRSRTAAGKACGHERGPSDAVALESARSALAAGCWAWDELPLVRRVGLLDEVVAATANVAPAWVARECERKHVAWGSPIAGEEWWNGPLSALRAAHRLKRDLRQPPASGRLRRHAAVATVSGRDSVSSLPFIETLLTLFEEDQLVLLELTPGTVNLAAVLDTALHPLIEAGYVQIAIGDRVNEAGNVNPVIVVPADWSATDLDYQARVIATMMTHGGGYEPGAARLLITERGWSGRERLLAALRRLLSGAPNRYAFHPGAHGRFAQLMQAHPEMELLGEGHWGSLPWGLIPDLDPDTDDVAFVTDPFAPILSETSLRCSSVPAFIASAVELSNRRASGDLFASLIVHPSSVLEPTTASALERGIAQLDYRTVTINLPPFLCAPSMHRAAGDRRDTKAVLRGRFHDVLTPPWLLTHPHSQDVYRRATSYETRGGARQLAAILWHSIRR